MTRAELKALILSLFEDNITELISPKDGRDSFDALIDNLLNLEDDYNLLGLKVHTTGRVYNVGDTYYYGQGIYGVTASHTGGASPDFTKATLIASVNTSAILDHTSGMTVTDGQVCNFHGTLIRVNTGTGTVTSTDPITDGFWTFLNFKNESSATTSGAYTYNGQNLNAKNVNIGITGNMTITFARIQKYGIYKITFSNSFAPKTVSFTDLCTNMYTGATITSLTIPTGDCVIYIAKAFSGYYHIGGRVLDLTAIVSNSAYDSSWLGNSTQGASKNAIYEKIESVIADYNSRIDAAVEGVKWKTPVQVLTDENIDLLVTQSNIDGEDIFEGDYVALINQSDPTENGIYVLNGSDLLVRSNEADTGDELAIAQFIVLNGTHANETWGVNNRVITLGVDAISITIRNTGSTPEATEYVSGKGKIAQDSQVDALLTSDPSLPLQSNTWISLRGLKRALNWVLGLFYTKSESDTRFLVSQNTSGGEYDYNQWVKQNGTDIVKVPVIKNKGFQGSDPSSITISDTYLQTNDFKNADILMLQNRKSGNITLTADEITVFFSVTGTNTIILKPLETVLLIRTTGGVGFVHYNQFGPFTYGGSGGGGTWGSIIGTLSDQTDLWAELTSKQDSLGYTPENLANKGASNGYAPLVSGLVPSSYLPSFVDDIIEGYKLSGVFYSDSGHTTALTGEVGKIYVDLTAGQSSKQYRWSGTVYIQITNGLIASTDDVPEGATNKYWSNALTIAATLTGFTGAAGTVTSSDSILSALQKIVGNLGLYQKKADYIFLTQSADITLSDFTAPEKAVDGFKRVWTILADATHVLIVPGGWQKENNLAFYNGIVNTITAEAIGGVVYYTIANSTVSGTDTTPPALYFAATNYNGTNIDFIFNEPVAGTPTITPTGFTVSSYSFVNNILRLVPTANIINGASISANVSNVTDIVGNVITPITGYFITNYTANNYTAVRGQNGGANGILTAIASKFQLSTGAGGTDTPCSIVARIKISSIGTSVPIISVGAYAVGIASSGQLYIRCINGGNTIYRNTTAVVSVGQTYMIVFSYDGSKTLAGLKLTINNVNDAGGTFTSGTYTGGETTNTCVLLSTTANPHYVDEVLIVKRELNSTEKTELYNSNIVKDYRTTTTWTSAPSDVIYYNKLDQGGEGNTDLSPSPATITGTPNYVSPI